MANYDIIIIGSGLAGLTAGLFSARQGLSTLVFESNIPGGHLISIEKIEDFPGFPDGVSGYEICPNLQRQASDHGAEFQRAEVLRIEAKDKAWSVVTEEETYQAKAVIVATGSTLKQLGVAGEEKLMGRGVSHCASCDGPMCNGQTVGVVGGGDSALQEALTLTNYAERVLLFHHGETFSAQQTYRQRVLSNSKITPHYQTAIEGIVGDEVVTGVRVRDLKSGETSQIELTGIFIYVGMQPNTAILEKLIKLSDTGHVPTDISMQTERPGLYAAGDIRQDSARQAITSAGDGATAAIAACRYINAILR
ncbi:MAG: FAD-binding protein [Deltaproteobacteria bacterium]|nr:FAD-binding protein [Deltaproteobacteria bacterium]